MNDNQFHIATNPEILKEVSNNSIKDFNCLYQTFQGILSQYAQNLLGTEIYANDIVQDVFIKYWLVLEEGSVINDSKKFLYTLTRNLCIDKIRNRKRDNTFLKELSRQTTVEMMEQFELQRLLQESINRLSPQRKKVFVLIKIEGWKREKAAKALGISEETAKEAMRQALRTIRNYICAETGMKNKVWKKAKLKKTGDMWLKEVKRKVA